MKYNNSERGNYMDSIPQSQFINSMNNNNTCIRLKQTHFIAIHKYSNMIYTLIQHIEYITHTK